jgi:hypothetical protein
MKDFWGNNLAIGDTVAVVNEWCGRVEVLPATVVGFTKTMVKVEIDWTQRYPNYRPIKNKKSSQIVKKVIDK